jgi:hypothetical protein
VSEQSGASAILEFEMFGRTGKDSRIDEIWECGTLKCLQQGEHHDGGESYF